MQSMIQAVLDLAALLQVTSLAMPLLGAGHAQWPVNLTAKAHISKVLEAAHSKPEGSPLKVGAYLHALAPLLLYGGPYVA